MPTPITSKLVTLHTEPNGFPADVMPHGEFTGTWRESALIIGDSTTFLDASVVGEIAVHVTVSAETITLSVEILCGGW